jgi:antitoxin ParD1/3/4
LGLLAVATRETLDSRSENGAQEESLMYTVDMKIHLRPELEEMIKQDVERGAYQSADEFVEHAISLLHQQENWLGEHGAELRKQIEAGYASAQRGELLDPEEVRTRMEDKKRIWLATKRQA